MDRPTAFQNAHVTLQNLPYSSAEEASFEVPSLGGVLGCGQTLWTAESLPPRSRPRSVMAFVEGIGRVFIDPRWISSVRQPSR